ncbi:uncharacterized protein LOC106166457 [Lingula anatina]|uniref:Uncharacterized protein LOC106166457 n=1 Tax=Lingula anatina TaxID=7574 RepID=A0A1S3ISH2_LINAN|nr:uncharacterized protein LOC106166457 [Lingula anatina]|eukprot:XP_013400484.1 uncharacterized protein LOC106166457 [Lingula anatina]
MAAPRGMTREHRAALIKNRLTLVNDITEPSLLSILNFMYSKSVLSDREYEYIKSKRIKHDMNEEFLDILIGKSDVGYYVFLEALWEEGMHHVVSQLQGGSGAGGDAVESMPGVMMMSNHHKDLLRRNRMALTNDMTDSDTKFILNHLLQEGVFTQRDNETVRAERTCYARAEKLLDLLPGKGESAFEIFRYALCEGGQEHLAALLQDGQDTYPVQATDQSLRNPQGYGQPYGQQHVPQYGHPYDQQHLTQYGHPYGQPFSAQYQQFQ